MAKNFSKRLDGYAIFEPTHGPTTAALNQASQAPCLGHSLGPFFRRLWTQQPAKSVLRIRSQAVSVARDPTCTRVERALAINPTGDCAGGEALKPSRTTGLILSVTNCVLVEKVGEN